MNAAEFNRLVEQPSLLKDVNAGELRDLVGRYPFCASAHLLLIKKYQLDKHSDFDARLSLTAAYANDRKSLYRLLYDDLKFKTIDREEEAAAVVTHEQRVGAEILLGNESGAFSDYTPRNQVAEVETYESMEFIKSGWADDLRVLENQNSDQMSEALEEQFTLASEKAGGGAEIVHDFDNLDEENDDELLEEKIEFELESTKALEGAIENAVEEHEYLEYASISNSSAEITHDFDGLAEVNENELLEEKRDVELESTKALEDAIENAVEENEYQELASLSNSGAEITHDFDGLAEENENELLEESLDVELESTKALENALEHNLIETDYTFTAKATSDNGVGKHESNTIDTAIGSKETASSNFGLEESDLPKQENLSELQLTDKESLVEVNNTFEPSKGLADLLGESDLEFEESDEKLVEESIATHQGIESYSNHEEDDYDNEATLQDVLAEANLPTSVEEHEAEEIVAEHRVEEFTATNLTSDLTPRQEVDAPMAQEDLVGTEHQKITSETESAYKTDEPKIETPSVIHQGVELQGSRTFTDWLKLFKTEKTSDLEKTSDIRRQTSDVAVDTPSLPQPAQKSTSGIKESKPSDIEEDNELYDREWKARKLEMESWTAGLPDELKVIDEFVAQHSIDKSEHQPNISVAELAERSLIVNDEFLTETMAKVYASQGKYKKAADVIEKLMLKNPSKKLYFADLLEDYKKKITS